MTERDIFISVLQKDNPAERRAYLDLVCAGQPELRNQVENLLRLCEGAGSFLEKPAAEVAATGEFPTAAQRASGQGASGAVIGPYKLVEQIGEGGMGSVWMAQQTEPVKRVVAIKVIKAGMDSKAVLARFEAERQALAMMDHPNIAKVFDAGATRDGRPFFVMELVKGTPITKFCDERKLTPRQRLELFVPVCLAIQHAHQKGIIHRDIKPSNVLVALYDDRPVPKVIDFGVAKAAGQPLTDLTLMTGYGAVVGTPEYMSPEQASFNQLDVDTRSDIYSLGVLLYELLTGTTPIDRKSLGHAALLEILRIVREVEAPKPSTKLSSSEALPTIAANRGTEPAKLGRLLKGELDWILLKALEKDRTRRYETANGFAAEVQRYLAGEQVQAVPPSVSYRFKKFIRRNKGPVVATSMVVLAVVGGAIASVYGLMESRKQRDATALRELAEQQRDTATRARDGEQQARQQAESAREMLARVNNARTVDLAHRAWKENQVGRAQELLDSCPPKLRGWEWHYVQQLCHAELLMLGRDAGLVSPASFSPDGFLVVGLSDDGVVRVWDAQTGKELLVLRDGARGGMGWVLFSPDGERIVATGGTARVWDARSGVLLHRAGLGNGADSFSPDGVRIYTEAVDGVRVWDAKTGASLPTLPGEAGKAPAMALSADGSRVVTTDGWTERLWDAKTGALIATIGRPPTKAEVLKDAPQQRSAAFSPDGRYVVTTDWGPAAKVWDATSGKEVLVLRAHGRVHSACFSPDGRTILTSGFDTTARLWDAKSGTELRVLRGHTSIVGSAAFSRDGARIVTAGADGVRIWDAGAGEPGVAVLNGLKKEHVGALHGAELRAVYNCYSPDGSRIVAWTGSVLASRPDGSRITAEVFDTRTGAVLLTLKGHTRPILTAAYSPDGSRIATADIDGIVRIWDAHNGAEVTIIRGVGLMNNPPLSFSRDGSRIAGVTSVGAKIWSATTGAELVTFKGHTRPVCSATYSADDSRVVTASEDGTVRVWDASTGQEEIELRGHVGPVMNASFSPDGSRIVSGGYDKTVRVWDTHSGTELIVLTGHAHPLGWVAFTPDGSRLVAWDRAVELRVWGGPPIPPVAKMPELVPPPREKQ
jgi:eukaryotic-like serine/threonine-protein kinase